MLNSAIIIIVAVLCGTAAALPAAKFLRSAAIVAPLLSLALTIGAMGIFANVAPDTPIQ